MINLRNFFRILIILMACSPLVSVVAAPSEQLFQTNTTGCNVHPFPRAQIFVKSPWKKKVNSVLTALQSQDFEKLSAMLHRRLPKKAMSNLKILLDMRYRKPWNWSVYKFWALSTPGGEKVTIGCDSNESITVVSLFGYDKQVGLLLQLMAKNELARLYLGFVPSKGNWVIGGVHLQQWTQQGQDYSYWVEQARSSLEIGAKAKAYIAADVAQKLLMGGDFLVYSDRKVLVELRDQIFSKNQFLEKVKTSLQEPEIVYVSSFLSDDGTGLLVRERLQKSLGLDTLRRKCKTHGARIARFWLGTEFTGGIKCSYVLPHENPRKEGVLGGFYLAKKDLSKKN